MTTKTITRLPEVSEAGMAYLESRAFQESFCSKCPWNTHYEGEFNEATGFGEPPHNTCPAEFDFFDPACKQRGRLRDIMEFLKGADELWEQ